MKHVKFVLLLLILFIGRPVVAEEDYVLYADQIVRIFAKEMKQDYDLICIGSGGRMNDDVEEIDVPFIAYRHLTIEEAREIEVKAMERLLALINSNAKIRPYLREYPFPVSRAKVSISLRTPEDNRPLDGSVAYVSVIRNKIFYRSAELQTRKILPPINGSKNPLPCEFEEREVTEEVLIDLKEEPYEEALKIVQRGPSCLKK